MDVIVKAVEAEIPEKIVKFYIWDAMNEEEKEQGDNKLRDLDGNEIKNDNVPQKGVQEEYKRIQDLKIKSVFSI